jgi:uncharacterized protein
MRSEDVEYWSGNGRIRAWWRTPDLVSDPIPAIIHAPGWFGLKDHKGYELYHRGFTDAGFGVLAIDYRGFGDSEGERGRLSPTGQLEDLRNAVTYLNTRPDVLSGAVGVYGGGGTGGGNAILLAGVDDRVRAVVSQVPVADGRDWLHRMRTEYDWLEYLKALEQDRRQRVLTGKGGMVTIRGGLMVETEERKQFGDKHDVDSRMPAEVPLAIADDILDYRPIDVASRLVAPLLVVAVENDATVPTDHQLRLFEAARGPKKLILQRGTSHYRAYRENNAILIPEMAEWYREHLHPVPSIVRRVETPRNES